MARILLAKTALDGHWRGLNTVARALRDDGHEVVIIGMARDDEIASAAIDEDVDLVGLNIGGRVEVVERILDALEAVAPDLPVFAGGTVAPWTGRRLAKRGVEVFPPGSSLADITAAAEQLVNGDVEAAGSHDGAGIDGPSSDDPTPANGRVDELLDVAARQFHEQGYGNVGMRAIAEAAGASTGILYHHFQGKREMLHRICLSMTQTFVDAHLPILEGPGPAPERLHHLVVQHIVFFWDRRIWLSVAFGELRSLDPDELAEVTVHRRRYQKAIRATIIEGHERGEFHVEDPVLATMALLDMVNGVNAWFNPDGRLDITELADHYADLVVERLVGGSATHTHDWPHPPRPAARGALDKGASMTTTTTSNPTSNATSNTTPAGRERIARAAIGDQLRRHAQHDPDKPAVIFHRPDGTREVHTYGSLNDRVNRFAHALAEAGVSRGDVVAMLSRNSPDYVTAWYASLKLGAAFTGINFTFKQPEVAYQVGHCRPKVVIVEDVFAGDVAAYADTLDGVATFVVSDVTAPGQAPDGWMRFSDLVEESRPAHEPDVDVAEGDIAMLQYTSGTEAFPKGVMIPHRNYLISTTPAWMTALGIKPEDRWLFLMPFFAIAGLGSMTTLTLVGATLILVHSIDAKQAVMMIADEGVTIMAQTPTFYLQMAREPSFADADLGELERCLTYGGTVPRAMVDAWRAVRPEIVWGTYWGQSELSQLGSVGWFSTLDDIPDGDATWIGRPVPQLEVRVVDADGNEAPVGELIARSPSAMLGYLDDPERTEEVFRDGWLHTGDIVRIDEDGNLFFFDRMKDMIKSGGMNVSSQEVERVLYGHDAVEQCAVVGMPDEYWSEAVTAFVVVREGVEVDPAELITHCKAEVADFKAPKAVHLVDALPRDTQGKILKRELRDMAPSQP